MGISERKHFETAGIWTMDSTISIEQVLNDDPVVVNLDRRNIGAGRTRAEAVTQAIAVLETAIAYLREAR